MTRDVSVCCFIMLTTMGGTLTARGDGTLSNDEADLDLSPLASAFSGIEGRRGGNGGLLKPAAYEADEECTH